MKIRKIIYWIVTGLFLAMMAFTSYNYFTRAPEIMTAIKELNMPYNFFIVLGTAKVLGILALLFSKWDNLKEWAYAGFTFTMIGATWMHISMSQSFIPALGCLLFLALSYFFRQNILTEFEEHQC